MIYRKKDKILQINKGVFIRLGIILDITDDEYEIKWLEKGDHVKNLTTIKKYPFSFIHSELFDLINKDNIDFVMDKYIKDEDYETCQWIRDKF